MRIALVLTCIVITLLIRMYLQEKKNSKAFVVFCSLIFIAFACFRGLEFTSDITRYDFVYQENANKTFSELFILLFSGEGKDVTYTIFSMLFYKLHIPSIVFFHLIYLFFAYSLGRFISKNSNDVFLSFLMYLTFGYYYFTLTAVRQSIAMAFLLLSYEYIGKRKFVKFTLLVLLAGAFHLSALSFILAYPLYKLKFNPKAIWTVPVIYFVAARLARPIINIWNSIIPKQYAIYAESTTRLSSTNLLLAFLLCLGCIFISISQLREDKRFNFQVLLVFVSIIPYALSSSMFAEMFRVGYYYSIFSISAIPNAFAYSKLNQKYVDLFYISFCAAITAYFFVSSNVRFIYYF